MTSKLTGQCIYCVKFIKKGSVTHLIGPYFYFIYREIE